MPTPVPRPSASLRELAQEHRLPAHQPMDQVTLGWIVDNRPANFDAVPSFPRPGRMLVPPASWFADAALAESNHGIRHSARVSLHAALMAEEYGLDGDDVAASCVAGAVHDCQRRDDRADLGHGRRAERWLERHAETVTSALGHDLPAAVLQQAATAISLHDVPYDQLTPEQERAYRDAPHLVDVLKAADCLDRYRLPLQRWWPDISRLRIPMPTWLPPAAFAFVVHSEQARLDGATSAQALASTRQILTSGQ